MRIGDCPKRLFTERPEITTKSPEVRLVRFSRTGPMVPHFSPKSDGRQTFEETMTDPYCPRNRLHSELSRRGHVFIVDKVSEIVQPLPDVENEIWKWSPNTFLGWWHKFNDLWLFLQQKAPFQWHNVSWMWGSLRKILRRKYNGMCDRCQVVPEKLRKGLGYLYSPCMARSVELFWTNFSSKAITCL